MANISVLSLIDVSFDMDEALTLPPNFGHQISESNTLVDEMPTVTSSAHDVCSICMEGFEECVRIGKKVACGHVYHAPCISSWLSNCNSCPLCRFDIFPAAK
ncbi:uncharacterized protein LOC126670635 [Mercurialis annua]|uniref:uncharacterized protein LOC126670635 n=1 Tax=Mercurialis annua TaxID=3986 RepID=UPI00215F55EE|nr:uncharacterized protein LOC126670635 [Mercurialis annua]